MARYTEEQLAVINHPGGHALVAAVAGSGKTQTLLGRIRHLLRTCPPKNIGVFMFNRAAREDFQARLQADSPEAGCPDIRTLNAAGERLTQYFQRRGDLPAWQLEGREYVRRKLADQALAKAFADVISRFEEPDKPLQEAFMDFIQRVKSSVRPASKVFDSGGYARSAPARCFPAAFDGYEQLRREKRVRFLDDQLWAPVQLLRRSPELVREVENKFDHIIVDEAQDLNEVQIEFIRLIAGTRAEVLIVGDDDQSIYGWRGARASFMVRDFERQFRPCTRYTLSQTFRYGHEVSLLATNLISNNQVRIPKVGRSHSSTPRTRVTCVPSTTKEVGAASTIARAAQEGSRLSDITVLVRYYSAALPVEFELLGANIPYHVYGRPPLLKIPELSALVAVLQIAAGQFGTRCDQETRQELIRAVLSRPTLYLRSEQMARIVGRAAAAPDDVTEVLRGSIDSSMSERTADQIRRRADLIGLLPHLADSSTPVQLLETYLKGVQFKERIEEQSDSVAQASEILGNVHAFIEMTRRHNGTVQSFLDEIDPLLDVREQEPPAGPHVRITSIHRAKGLQWDTVLLAGLSSDWPSSVEDDVVMAEERRLAYVGMTRAKRHLVLLHPADPLFQRSLEAPEDDFQLHAERGTANQGSLVSEFLWEARVGVSSRVAVQIEQGATVPWAPGLYAPEVCNSYLESIEAPLRYAPKELPAAMRTERKVKDGPVTPESAAPGTRVYCESFGAGEIEEWVSNRVARICFAGNERRMIVAEILHLAAD